AGEEQVGFKVDLAVGDGDHVRGDVGGNVAFLGLDDGKRGERTAAVLVGELGGAFEQAAVKVEDVAGVGLAAGRTAKQQGELPVGGRLLAEVVVDAQDVLALPHEVFAHGAAGVGGDVLQRRGVGSGGVDDDGVVHRAVVAQGLHNVGDGRFLLADRDVDADHRVGRAPVALLVDDGVDGDG